MDAQINSGQAFSSLSATAASSLNATVDLAFRRQPGSPFPLFSKDWGKSLCR